MTHVDKCGQCVLTSTELILQRINYGRYAVDFDQRQHAGIIANLLHNVTEIFVDLFEG